MGSEEKLHTDELKITNDWNCHASCISASLAAWDLENFKRLTFFFCTECTNRPVTSLLVISTMVPLKFNLSFHVP